MYQQFGLKSHLWPLVAEPPNIPNIHSTAEYKYRYKYKYKAENPSLTTGGRPAKYSYVGNEDDSKGSDKIQFSVDPCCKLISFLVYFCPPGRQNFYSLSIFICQTKKHSKEGLLSFPHFKHSLWKWNFSCHCSWETMKGFQRLYFFAIRR